MADALETVLRGASHIDRGMTLIEDLVATSERSLVQKNARWATKHGVLRGADLDRAIDALGDHLVGARRAGAIDSKIRIMFITGFAAVALNARGARMPDTKVLSKPFHLRDLVLEINKLLAA